MNIQRRYTALISALTLAATGLTVAKAPEIDRARIDVVVTQLLKQADTPTTQRPDGATIRKDVTARLQEAEVLKNEALKAGLDKKPEIQAELENLQADFYARQYVQHLINTTQIDDADLRSTYDLQTRTVKLQQVAFGTAEEARQAQALLLKGLSFEELMKRHPNPEQEFLNNYISAQQLPPILADTVNQMTRGQVTRTPLQIDGKFYLFKLAAVGRNPDAPPFEQIKNQLAEQAKQHKVQEQITKLLKDSGLQP